MLEAALAVLVAPAGCLHDAVEGHERGDDEFSHAAVDEPRRGELIATCHDFVPVRAGTAGPAGSVIGPMDLDRALHAYFGHEAFRPGQEEAVRAAVGPPARDVLVVMPTGAGKSLCYQLPALVRDDLTLVVSPLVSLMQDQVQALARAAPGSVAMINAQQDSALNREALDRAAEGSLRLLYVAPERFSSAPFLQAIKDVKVGLFVVDEAHCVSQWGHDFRPDYFRLADAARWLETEAIIASTATATPQVAADIERRLGLRDPVRVTTGFDRPNLSFGVVRCSTTSAKHRRIAAVLAEPGATPAIVYAGTRSGTDRLADALDRSLDVRVAPYHAGLDREERSATQRAFMAGEVDVIVATNAFGMGIDKADVRTVCHESVPPSLEAWYQEAGRAGPRRAALARDAVRGGPRQGPARLLHPARGGRRRRHRRGREAAGGAVGERPLRPRDRRAGLGGGVEGRRARPQRRRCRPRARDRRPPGARRRGAPGAVDARPRARAAGGAVRRPGARGVPHVRRRGPEGALEAVPVGVGVRRGRRVPSRGAAAPLRRSDAAADRSRRAVLRRLRRELDPRRRGAAGGKPRRGGAPPGNLDEAILSVVADAEPPVGRTRTVEVLRGSRSKVVQKNGYDGLPAYGTFDHLTSGEVLARVDELVTAGRLRSTGGAFPKLQVVAAEQPVLG